MTSEVKEQLKVLEKIDRINVKRKQEREKEKLLRAAKSRSKADDPELAKIKEKAKQVWFVCVCGVVCVKVLRSVCIERVSHVCKEHLH